MSLSYCEDKIEWDDYCTEDGIYKECEYDDGEMYFVSNESGTRTSEYTY